MSCKTDTAMTRVFVYVPRDDVSSIRQNGLMSARALQEKLGIYPPPEKYKQQVEAAVWSRSYIEHLRSCSDDVVTCYLDWRVEDVTKKFNGASAIYFLWRPIPSYAVAHMRSVDFDVSDKALLSFDLEYEWHSVSPDGDYDLSNMPDEYWEKVWKRKIERKSNLWLDGIPHAYILPNNGFVPPQKITFL